MDNGNSTGLLATVTGFIITVGVATAAAVKGYGWVFDKRNTQEDSEEHTAEDARAALDDVQKEWFDGMRQDLKEARAENALLRKDRDRGWDLARAWREVAKDQRHIINGLRQVVRALLQEMHKAGVEVPAPQDPGDLAPLAGLEEIEGKKS